MFHPSYEQELVLVPIIKIKEQNLLLISVLEIAKLLSYVKNNWHSFNEIISLFFL